MKSLRSANKHTGRPFGETVVGRVLMLLPAAVAAFMWLAASPVVFENSEAVDDPKVSLWRILLTAVFSVSVFYGVLYGRLGKVGRTVRKVLQLFGIFGVPVACFYILETFTHDPMEMNQDVRLLNIAFFVLAELVVLFISRRPAVASSAVILLTAVAGIANDLAVQARSIPVYPWDVASLGVALSVAGNYEFTLTMAGGTMIAVMSGLVLISVSGGAKLNLRPLWVRIAAILVSVGCLGGYVGYLQTDRLWTDFPLYPYLFTPKVVYDDNGFMVSFLSHLKYLKVEKPEGYSEAEIEAFMAKYEEASRRSVEETSSAVRPNVIVLMNEAMSDLSVLTGGQDYWVESDPLEYYNSLTENTQRGNVYVSVKGGNTPNSEFEFLTGLSLQYLPLNSIPYQQYVKTDTPSLATQLSELGYEVYAMHPYYGSGWLRETVYPRLGFPDAHCYFIEKFYEKVSYRQRLRGFVSDKSEVNLIIDTYLQQKAVSTDPAFIFGVTIQNHGGYTDAAKYDNYSDTIHAKGQESSVKLTTYLSLLDRSDAAFRYLVEYFADVEEPTVICMFGDHQPNDDVVNALAAQYGVDISSSLEAQQLRYQVPVVIWANYDIEEKDLGNTSLNYLGTLLLEAAGLPLTPQQEFLRELMDTYPAMNGNGVLLKDGRFVSGADLAGETLYEQYKKLQYNDLFDTKHRLEAYFSYPLGQK